MPFAKWELLIGPLKCTANVKRSIKQTRIVSFATKRMMFDQGRPNRKEA